MGEDLLVTIIMDALAGAGNSVRSFQMNGGHMIEVHNSWHSATIFPFPIEMHETIPTGIGAPYRILTRIEPARVVSYDGHTILPDIGDPDYLPTLFDTLDREGLHVPRPASPPSPAEALPFAPVAQAGAS